MNSINWETPFQTEETLHLINNGQTLIIACNHYGTTRLCSQHHQRSYTSREPNSMTSYLCVSMYKDVLVYT